MNNIQTESLKPNPAMEAFIQGEARRNDDAMEELTPEQKMESVINNQSNYAVERAQAVSMNEGKPAKPTASMSVKVLNAIRGGLRTAKSISNNTGLKPSQVYVALNNLKTAGKVKGIKVDGKPMKYSIANAGMRPKPTVVIKAKTQVAQATQVPTLHATITKWQEMVESRDAIIAGKNKAYEVLIDVNHKLRCEILDAHAIIKYLESKVK